MKEYWIIRDGNLVGVDLDEPVDSSLEITHVVEMAAYRELEARLSLAVETLKKWDSIPSLSREPSTKYMIREVIKKTGGRMTTFYFCEDCGTQFINFEDVNQKPVECEECQHTEFMEFYSKSAADKKFALAIEACETITKLEADKALVIEALHHYDSAHYHAETGLPCHADNVAFETLKQLEAE